MSQRKVEEFVSAHLETSSISIIDDIINAVNEIMYKCTEGMEQYLSNRQRQILIKHDELRKEKERQRLERQMAKKAKEENKKDNDEEDDDVIIEDEDDKDENANDPSVQESSEAHITLEDISIGSAKLESLLEHSVDKNFDRFELYTLRNVFNVPFDLVDEGWIRLQEHKDLVIDPRDVSKSKELDDEYIELITQMKQEIMLNKLLNGHLNKCRSISKFLVELKEQLEFLDNKPLGDTITVELKTKLKGLQPLNETLQFLIFQVIDLFDKVGDLRSKIDGSKKKNKDLESIEKSSEDHYLDHMVSKALRVTKIKHKNQEEFVQDNDEAVFANFVTAGKNSKRRRINGKYEDTSRLGDLLEREY